MRMSKISDSTFQQLRRLNVIKDHSVTDSTACSVKLIYVSKYYSQKSMSDTVLQKNCSFVVEFEFISVDFILSIMLYIL